MISISNDLLSLSQKTESQPVSIDLSAYQREVSNFAQNLMFKAGESRKHFKKHKNDHRLKVANINTAEMYITATQVNIVKTIFEKGFVVRTNLSERVAFFTTDQQGFPDKMTAIGVFEGVGKLITFFAANYKTPLLTIKDFKGEHAYIAYFEKGLSEKGWQKLEYTSYGSLQPVLNEVPEKELAEPINFLKF